MLLDSRYRTLLQLFSTIVTILILLSGLANLVKFGNMESTKACFLLLLEVFQNTEQDFEKVNLELCC